MKKIFTLAVTLMMIACTTASAQSLTVFAHGEQVADGATINIKGVLTEEKYEDGDYSLVFRQCKWDSEIFVKTSGSTKGSVEMTADGEGWQICWPEQCKPVGAGKTLNVEGIFTSSQTDLQIHCEMTAYDEELNIPESNSAKVVIKAGDESVTLYLVNDKPSAAVDALATATSSPIYYNLQGQKIDNPSKGIFIKVAGGRSSKVIL